MPMPAHDFGVGDGMAARSQLTRFAAHLRVIGRSSRGVALAGIDRALFSPEVQAGCCFRVTLVSLAQKVPVVWTE